MSGGLVLAALVWSLLAPLVGAAPDEQGYATHYAVGVMERVARHRGMSDDGCLVAGVHDDIGAQLVVSGPHGTDVCTVVDVPQPYHRQRFLERKIVLELGWPAAQKLCGLKRVGERPARDCPVKVWRIDRD